MQLKYAADLQRYRDCPPVAAAPCTREAFRFVHADIDDPRNFLTPAGLSPRRDFRPGQRCVSHALSFWASNEQAVAYFSHKQDENPNFNKTIGTHLARGTLSESAGIACPPRQNGHFSFFEAANADFAEVFEITGSLRL